MSVKYAARHFIACLVFVVGINDKDREVLLLVGFGPARPKQNEPRTLIFFPWYLENRGGKDFVGAVRRKLCAAMILAMLELK